MSAPKFRSLSMKAAAGFLLLSLIFTISLVTGAGNPARAHISADKMPDSVAEVEYSIYLEFKPEDLLIRNKLGMVYYRMGKMSEAAREFFRILKAEPENFDALDGMGLVKAAQGDYEEAVRLHREAAALNPGDMMIHYHLGVALEKTGRLQEAAEAYAESLEQFNEQYPSGTENKDALEFKQQVNSAIGRVKAGL